MAVLFPFGCSQEPGLLSPEARRWVTQHGAIGVGYSPNAPPLSFQSNTGQAAGFAVDVWRMIGDKLQLRRIEFRPEPLGEQIEGIRAGRLDSSVGLYPVRERQDDYRFSDHIAIVEMGIYVRRQYRRRADLGALDGLVVGVVREHEGEAIARRSFLHTRPAATHEMVIHDLIRGRSQAAILDVPIADSWLERIDSNRQIKRVGNPVGYGYLSFPIRRDNTILLEILQTGLAMISESEWRALEKKWELGHLRRTEPR